MNLYVPKSSNQIQKPANKPEPIGFWEMLPLVGIVTCTGLTVAILMSRLISGSL